MKSRIPSAISLPRHPFLSDVTGIVVGVVIGGVALIVWLAGTSLFRKRSGARWALGVAGRHLSKELANVWRDVGPVASRGSRSTLTAEPLLESAHRAGRVKDRERP